MIPKSCKKYCSHTILLIEETIPQYLTSTLEQETTFLFLGTPGDKITSNICAIPRSQFLISFVLSISSIIIGLNRRMIMKLTDNMYFYTLNSLFLNDFNT